MADPGEKSAHYDVVVVGAGPAGISAAINVANRKKLVAVFDGRKPFAKAGRAPKVPNYPGFQFATGEELKEAFLDHLDKFDVPFFQERVSKVMPEGDEIAVFTDKDMYHARAVILTVGVHKEPDIEGEDELVGRGVSYCANCDGRLFGGRDVAYLSYAPEGEEEAGVLAEDFGAQVTYVPLYKGTYDLPEGVRVTERQRPDGLSRNDGKVSVRLREGALDVDAVFIYRPSVSPESLVEGISVDDGHIEVNRHMQTDVSGVFAAGDCTGEPYQIAKAVGEGQVAALQALRYLREDRKQEREEAPEEASAGASAGSAGAASESPALEAQDRENLAGILDTQASGPVRLLHFTQVGEGAPEQGLACGSCRDARKLIEEFGSLSPLLEVDVRDYRESLAEAEKMGVERIPATLVGEPGEEAPRVRFYGLPSGYEFGVLLDDVLDISAGRRHLQDSTAEALAEIEEPVHLQVMATPTCPYCPTVVRLVHRFAQVAPAITADMVSIGEFPELAQRYDVRQVPMLVVNGAPQSTGAIDEARLLELVKAAAG